MELTMIFFHVCLIKIYFLSRSQCCVCVCFFCLHHSQKIYVKMNQKYCAICCLCWSFSSFYFDSSVLNERRKKTCLYLKHIRKKRQQNETFSRAKCGYCLSIWGQVVAAQIPQLLTQNELETSFGESLLVYVWISDVFF